MNGENDRNNRDVKGAEKTSFWKLIKEKTILIPAYQREYAQGRDNRRAELIRNGFVSSLLNAISSSSTLELDFIFGGNEVDTSTEFEPVDGQQRLTILFLLHWYVFMRAKRQDCLKTLGGNFLYKTRTTSRTFCQKICEEVWSFDFNLDEKTHRSKVANQIKKSHWFTGAMESDPTVKSMLKVIDTFHEQFNDNLNYEDVAEKLIGEEAPVLFYCLNLNEAFKTEDDRFGLNNGSAAQERRDTSGADIRDLYIKMNSRGIALTDFEVFKADLQKKETDENRFDLLSGYLSDKDSPAKRTEIVGKFNNEYTTLFFNLIDDGKIVRVTPTPVVGDNANSKDGKKVTPTSEVGENASSKKCQMFDISMMNFINEIFRMNFFCAISEVGVPQKEYRGDNDYFKKMSGRELSEFIRTSGRTLNEKYWGSDLENSCLFNKVGEKIESDTKQRKEFDRRSKEYKELTKEINQLLSEQKKAKSNVEKSSETYKRVKEVFKETFSELIGLLDLLFSKFDLENKVFSFDFSDEAKCCFSLKSKIKSYAADPQDKNALSAADSLARMGIYEFLIKFGIPDNDETKNAFTTWCRFVWKIDRNSDFKNFDEAIQTLRGYKKIISLCAECSSRAILEAIVKFQDDLENNNIDRACWGAPAGLQLIEEKIKAELVLADTENRWDKLFVEAEDYYCRRGQLWFLLELAKTNENYSFERFVKAFDVSRKVLNSEYKTEGTISLLFERALLAEKGFNGEFDRKDHLVSMGTNTKETKKFVLPDYVDHISHKYCNERADSKENDRYLITKTLFQEMVDADEIRDMTEWLKCYIERGDSSLDWKHVFIKNNLINKEIRGLVFRNGFEPDAWEVDGYNYTAIYDTPTRREGSGELYSFLLASKLSNEGVCVEYTTSFEKYLVDGFPSKYFTVYGYKVGYIASEFYFQHNGRNYLLGEIDEAFQKISNNEFLAIIGEAEG